MKEVYQDVKNRQAEHNTYYSNKMLLKDKKITKTIIIKIYNSLIRPVVTYRAEVVSITNQEGQLRVFNRKAFRTILDCILYTDL